MSKHRIRLPRRIHVIAIEEAEDGSGTITLTCANIPMGHPQAATYVLETEEPATDEPKRADRDIRQRPR